MKITKYEHACLVVEEGSDKLVIDPGAFSKSFNDFQNVTAVVVTHAHQDHFVAETLDKIRQASPGVKIYTTQEVAKEYGVEKVIAVTGGVQQQVGTFKLDFYGGEHAVIHSSYPVGQNVGVMVNNRLYYPGDSFSHPDKPVEVLAVPACAPWMKTGEAMDFLASIKPKIAFPTHNSLLSDIGASVNNPHLSGVAQSIGCQYQPLATGQSLDI